MRALYGTVASCFAALAVYASVQQHEAHLALAHRSTESYTAAMIALDNANTALDYVPGNEDREINLSGFRIDWPVKEKLPDLVRARASIDDALRAVPLREKPILQKIADQLREPGLHQAEKDTIIKLRQDYSHKQSEADTLAYSLQQSRRNNGTAALLFASAAGLLGILALRSRKT